MQYKIFLNEKWAVSGKLAIRKKMKIENLMFLINHNGP